jgi:calcium-dependent protein kinase
MASTFNLKKRLRMKCGTSYYIAPEVIQGPYNWQCDTWSIGVVLYILLSGVPPFTGPDKDGIYDAIEKGEYDLTSYPWTDVSSEAKDLVRRLLEYDVKARIHLTDALAHPWFEMNKPASPIGIKKQMTPALDQMLSYHAPRRLKLEASKIIINHLTADKFSELQYVFHAIDSEGTGFISAKNLKNALDRVGLDVAGNEIA